MKLKNQALPAFLLHLLKWEGSCVPTPAEDNAQAYERCRRQAFADDADDPGGPTMMGVTLRTFRIWRTTFLMRPEPTADDLRSLSYDEWQQIVEGLFWRYYSLHTVPFDCLALAIADEIWTSGRAGIRDVQEVLGCTPDGIIGRETLGAMRHRLRKRDAARAACVMLMQKRLERLRRLPRWQKFGQGWTSRADSIINLIPTLDLTAEGE